jgi:hypothetical protein
MPVTWTDAEIFWIACTSCHPIEPAIASYHLAIFIARQRRINRIATRLQQITILKGFRDRFP